ncbi:beta-ketoacyl-[acyl-carrier-protein] synthase family protein [Paenibacillus sp. 5J-6]|uniref:Beta-ketoacyl-[acyl-carrier-protein] synthase family protein n=1 Tax=Paenibacillus silvestris TaxID=2606219 RepID=A0A6L8URI1_9BACL|nr:beta-ketoacyl-[acyl-carrier-protein] synthase family protein [Paenibacillus silvestris]MZQ80574.1 beta-ketoacyl-[acyl-carrier-protein] synthase family protein [Paenibacillus silvestris]
MKRRIVVTGLGVMSPIGSGQQKFWNALVAGEVGTREIESFDTSMFQTHRGGEVRDMDPADYLHVHDPATVGRTTQLAIAASRLAVDDAKLLLAGYDMDKIGVCMGTTMANNSILEINQDLKLKHNSEVPASLVKHYPTSFISSAVSAEFGFGGPSLTVPTACAAGNYAIGWGKELIEDGTIDVAIVGGADAISRTGYTLFHRLGAIAPEVCQPFDKNRKGMMVSEGAGVLVLEEMESARKRGATIYAELVGYGLSCDAHHTTAPHPEGLGAVLAMQRALHDSNMNIDDISYISAHGTGTKANDLVESIAIHKVFGSLAEQPQVSSIKSMLGHTMGAASAIEAVACSLAIFNSVLPPTMNHIETDPECVSRIVPNEARKQAVHAAMSSSFAFGGNISVIILKGVS